MDERRGTYRILVGRSEERRQLGKLRLRWEDNIKVDLQGVVWGGVTWTGLMWLGIGTGGGLL
jgi:hypothetical protein